MFKKKFNTYDDIENQWRNAEYQVHKRRLISNKSAVVDGRTLVEYAVKTSEYIILC